MHELVESRGALDHARRLLDLHKQGTLYPLYDDQRFTPSFIDDIAHSVGTLLKAPRPGYYHCACLDATTPFEFGTRLLAATGHQQGGLAPGRFEPAKGRARRPRLGGLETRRAAAAGLKIRSLDAIMEDFAWQFRRAKALTNQPFAVLLGDDILLDGPNATSELIKEHEAKGASVIGVQEVPHEDVERYGVVDPGPKKEKAVRLRGIVEKPKPAKAPSDFAAIGRYVFSPGIFDCIKRTRPGRAGEIQLTDALRLLLKSEPVYALRIQGRRLDVGGRLEWLKANIEMALRTPDIAPRLREYLEGLDLRAKRPSDATRGTRSTKRSGGP